MSATSVGIVLTMEYIFAAIFGIILVHEELTWRIFVGGLLMMTGMYLVILFDQPLEVIAPNKHEKISHD